MNIPAANPAHSPFRDPAATLGTMGPETAARVISAASDLALVMDKDGVIRDLACADRDLGEAGIADWLGRPWIDVVSPDSQAKVQELLRGAQEGATPRWRHVNHPAEGGPDLPVNYAALKVGESDMVLAVGRDLRPLAQLQQRLVETQIEMEREYTRLRSAEARYRLLFKVTQEPILIVDAMSGKVIDANPAAIERLSELQRRVVDRRLVDLFPAEEREILSETLAAVRAGGRPRDVDLGQHTNRPVMLSVSLFREARSVYFLVRLDQGDLVERRESDRDRFAAVMNQLPDGLVITDSNRIVVSANAAFLEIIEVPSLEQAIGRSIDNWLGRLGFDVHAMVDSLNRVGAIRQVETVVNGALGGVEDVEVSAVSATDRGVTYFGFSIRPIRGRAAKTGGQTLQSVEQLAALVGKVPLKDLIRETTDIIERMCIEAALQLTGDNRASAAEMLGLSRQSLYVKLRRYGLIDSEGEEEA